MEVQDKLLSGLDKISLPVIGTIGPKGQDVLFQDELGNFTLTNDGVTIAKSIDVADPIEAAIIDIVKEAAKRTNSEAGDGTSTTILLSRILILKALELKKKGKSHRAIKGMFENVATKLLKRLEEQKHKVDTDKIVEEIARISANNDGNIAKTVLEATKAAGLDGTIFLDFNPDEKDEVEVQAGFRVPAGMIYQNLYADVTRPVVKYEKLPVIIFDKKLYYPEEAEHIIQVAKDLGYDKLVIVAKDFQGDAVNTFMANHMQGVVKLVLVRLENDIQQEDLATYIDGTIVSEAGGRRVDSIGMVDFTHVESVFADPQKVLIKTSKESKLLKKKVQYIKDELKKEKDNEELKGRLASLTNGIVTIKIGGRTQTEVLEKRYRFEDSINAVRAGQRFGFLVGGGLSLFNAFNRKDYTSKDESETARLIATASVERLAENSMLDLDYDKLTKEVGLNALTGEYENLLKAGVVEPFRATEMAIKNAVSVANIITSIGTFIVNDYDGTESTDGEE